MTCDYCGDDDVGRLITLESADASVGYREEMDVCERCLERLTRWRTAHAAANCYDNTE